MSRLTPPPSKRGVRVSRGTRRPVDGAAGVAPAVQPLERRVCLSAVIPLGTGQGNFTLRDNTLMVFGTAAADQVRFEMVPSQASDGQDLLLDLNGRATRFHPDVVRAITIDTFAGDDFIHLQRGVTAFATIHGGDGNDFMVGGGGHDWFWGDAGTDTVSFEDREADLFITLDDRPNDGDDRRENVHSDVENVIGGAGDDAIVGTLANIKNRFEGRGGDDVLSGVGGDDVLLGGPGDDELIGGDGNDALGGAGGRDIFDGLLEPADAAQDYPAEGAAELSGPVVSASNAGFQGNGYADFTNATGDTITFAVDAVEEGTYTLAFRYANGSSSDRPLELNVNDRITRRVSFAPTGGWTQWRTVRVEVSLEADPANQVTLRSIGSNGPNIDTLLVTPDVVGPPAQPLPQTHQAEDAERLAAEVSRTHAGYTGSGYVDFLTGDADVLQWRPVLPEEVEGPDEQPVVLEFRYANGGSTDRPLEVRANDVVIAPRLSFPSTGSWSTWRTVTVQVPAGVLRAGANNTVRVRDLGSSGPNIDAMTIRRREEPPPPAGRTFQAEEATVSRAVVARDNAGYTGSGYVDFVHGSGDSVSWSVPAGQAGTYRLSFRYANGTSADRPLRLIVNGRILDEALSFPPTGRWDRWAEVTADVLLQARPDNVVHISSNVFNGPNVDALTVRPL